MCAHCDSYLIVMPLCRRWMCMHIYTCLNLFPITSRGRFLLMPSNQLCAFALLLFANVIRLRQGYSSLLAPLAQSELLICSSVRMTFVKAQHPRPASQTAAPWRTTLPDNKKTLDSLKQQLFAIHSYRPYFSHLRPLRSPRFTFCERSLKALFFKRVETVTPRGVRARCGCVSYKFGGSADRSSEAAVKTWGESKGWI